MDCIGQNRSGFTLVELLVVIVVMGIMVGIGVSVFTPVLETAANNLHESNVIVLKGAANMALCVEGSPEDTVTWTSIECHLNDKFKASDYLEGWPEVPAYASGASGSYQVTISNQGEVGVTTTNSE